MEGLSPPDQFNHRIEYGSMWHICEEEHARHGLEKKVKGRTLISDHWIDPLRSYVQDLCRKYPMSQQQIVHWMRVCMTQFPVYMDYWAKNADEKRRKPVLQEQVFHVPYHLPSGRRVWLRGKWDGVSQYGKQFYMDENKTKGDVKPEQIRRQMDFDLQTMLYLTALRSLDANCPIASDKVAGVRYNVILRPLSGGKHSIRQHQPTKKNPSGESDSEFYVRLGELISSEPDYYFHRWVVDITDKDVERFRLQFLTPILEQLCDWWEWLSYWSSKLATNDMGVLAEWSECYVHWRTPYGFYNVLGEGGSTDMDEYLATGSEIGLERGIPLFNELKEE
jgi:hypothetical protein